MPREPSGWKHNSHRLPAMIEPVSVRHMAAAAFRAGELDEGLRWFREAVDRREGRLGNFPVMPCYSEARCDLRFQTLLREVKLMRAEQPIHQ